VELPRLDFQKVAQRSDWLKILMLLIPLVILLLLGALVFRWRIRRFGQ
jgi:hypothetical protein